MQHPQFILNLASKLVVVLFAGAGGSCTGIEKAIGRHVDIAANHNDDAMSCHRANHPQTQHHIEDVRVLDPRELCGARSVGYFHVSPDCFPAGTLVLTRRGYTPIEAIKVGDEVITHLNRWRRVTSTMSAVKPVLSIRGHGHPGVVVSQEHPFLARRRRDVWQTEPRGYQRTLEPEDWVKAGELDKGWYWATPTAYPQAEVPAVSGRGMEITPQLLWLAGRYVGDGWSRLSSDRAELVITCGRHEVESLRSVLAQWPRAGERCEFNELAWTERPTGTAYQFATSHRGLVEWLRGEFGHRAEAKRVPAWALGMSTELQAAFLDGYMSADGWTNGDLHECQTVSPALAFGMKALASALGKSPTVYRSANRNNIQGRVVNAREIYTVKWRDEVCAGHAQTFREDGREWSPIREQVDLGETAEVFNISVEEDESYIVEGLIVHNCTHFSQAKGGQPRDKAIRSLPWVTIKWAGTVRPEVITLENVKEIRKWGPLIAKRDKATGRVIKMVEQQTVSKTGKVTTKTVEVVAEPGERVPVDQQFLIPDPKRQGKTWRRFLRILREMGYDVEDKVLCAADFNVPQRRNRLFMIARCDGRPIVWPTPVMVEKPKTKTEKRWRGAHECIDWNLKGRSIFVTGEPGARSKPLAPATLRRVARGLDKFVLKTADPFIVPVTHTKGGDRALSIHNPMPVITTAKGGELMVASPVIVPATHQGADRMHGPIDPLPTVTCAHRGELMLATATMVQAGHGDGKADGVKRWGDGAKDVRAPVGAVTASGGGQAVATAFLAKLQGDGAGSSVEQPTPVITAGGAPKRPSTGVKLAPVVATLVPTGYGEREGQAPRVADLRQPLGVTVGTQKHALVTAFVEQANGGFNTTPAHAATDPVSVITTTGSQQRLATATMVHLRNNCDARDPKAPLQVVSAGGEHHGVAVATLVTNTSDHAPTDLRDAAPTVATGGHHALTTAYLTAYHSDDANRARDVREPAATIDTNNRLGLIEVSLSKEDEEGALRCAAFLMEYYSEGGQWSDLRAPANTITTKDRLALVTVWLHGSPYVIVDICLRMLTPRELARATSLPDNYIIERGHDGRVFTKTKQVKMIGNAVPPELQYYVTAANYQDVYEPVEMRKAA